MGGTSPPCAWADTGDKYIQALKKRKSPINRHALAVPSASKQSARFLRNAPTYHGRFETFLVSLPLVEVIISRLVSRPLLAPVTREIPNGAWRRVGRGFHFSMAAATSSLFKLSLQAQENEEVRLELETLVSLPVPFILSRKD